MNFETVDQIIQKNYQCGYSFFSLDNMRWFNSRVLPDIYGGCVFITSEKFDNKSPRLYTIREITEDGNLLSIGEFQMFKTLATARKYAKLYAENKVSFVRKVFNYKDRKIDLHVYRFKRHDHTRHYNVSIDSPSFQRYVQVEGDGMEMRKFTDSWFLVYRTDK